MSDATLDMPEAAAPIDVSGILTNVGPDLADLMKLRRRALVDKSVRDLVDEVLEETPDAIIKGFGFYAIGHDREAVEWLSATGDDVRVRHVLGRALIGCGRFESAAETLSELEREESSTRPALTEAYLRAGAADEARKALGKLFKEDAESAEGHYLKSYLCELEGDYDGAYAGYREALEIDEGHGKSLFRLAYCLDLDGNEDEAVATYERLRVMKPTYTNALVNLGVLYEDRGEYTKAMELYKEILDVFPNHHRARRFLKDARASLNMYYDEDLERTEDRRAQILRIPISDFELSVRSRNCLAKMQIETLGDLIKKTEQELLSYKNFGETSLQEIKDILAQKGLRLGMGREEQTASVQAAARTLLGIEPEQGDALEKAIDELELSVRSRNAMRILGVESLGDLARMSEKDLMQVKNFGQTSMNEVKEKLAEFGLALADANT